jgi:hypothetical protein
MQQIMLIFLGAGALVSLTVAGIFGLGLYMGWFRIGSRRSAANEDFTFTMDEDRIEELEKRAHTAKRDLENQAKDECVAPVENIGGQAAAPVQPLQK